MIEAEDDNGCTTTYSPVIINEPLDVNVDLTVLSNYNGVDISCFGFSDGVILANASGGSGNIVLIGLSIIRLTKYKQAFLMDSTLYHLCLKVIIILL